MGAASVKNMKNIVLTNEVAQVILNKIEAIKSDKNRLQLKIGLKSLGDGLACQTVLVNGGMMVEIGFKTADIPADYVEGSGSYFTVNVSAFASSIFAIFITPSLIKSFCSSASGVFASSLI